MPEVDGIKLTDPALGERETAGNSDLLYIVDQSGETPVSKKITKENLLKELVQAISEVSGVGLEFTWDGTSLGVKRESDAVYSYADLKGTKGDQGDVGYQPFVAEITLDTGEPALTVYQNEIGTVTDFGKTGTGTYEIDFEGGIGSNLYMPDAMIMGTGLNKLYLAKFSSTETKIIMRVYNVTALSEGFYVLADLGESDAVKFEIRQYS